jgi:hypothetical protein
MKKITALLSITIPLLALGCSGVKAPIEGRLDPHVPAQVMFSDRVLSDKTAVGVPMVTRDDSGGILHVEIPIRAAVNEQLFIDYRATFMDRNGQTISQSGWLSKVLEPNVPDQITVNSMGPRAADFLVSIRPSK